ncbi:hypothetical protein POTOM_008299 [Populus tomentosa]|uniref:Uncharacterized protein n=1 Tax=Populus tomentosa TaxID=118781 RepID=A0A8X8AGR7_POPTO|nr:hypothetical protein POTOM_008299 [Populus tomentosa]
MCVGIGGLVIGDGGTAVRVLLLLALPAPVPPKFILPVRPLLLLVFALEPPKFRPPAPLPRLVDLDSDVEPLTLLAAALTSRLVVVVVQSHHVRRLHPTVIHEGKDTVVEGTKKPTHYLAEKGAQVKDTIVERAKKSTQYVAEKGARVKDTIVESDKKTSEYVAEKAVTAKDVIAQNGKKVIPLSCRKKKSNLIQRTKMQNHRVARVLRRCIALLHQERVSDYSATPMEVLESFLPLCNRDLVLTGKALPALKSAVPDVSSGPIMHK